MTGWQYGMWGLFGGFCVEGLEFVGAVSRTGDWPWRQRGEPGALQLMVSVLIRLAISAGLAAAAGSTHQVSGPFGAVGVGVAAPLLIEQLLQPFQLAATAPTIALRPEASSTPSGRTFAPSPIVHRSTGSTKGPGPAPTEHTTTGVQEERDSGS
jgi:hypothetical protein